MIIDAHVLIPNLAAEVENYQLPQGPQQALTTKLEAALASLEAGNVKEASNILYAFIHLVNAQRGKLFTDLEADALIEAALVTIELVPD